LEITGNLTKHKAGNPRTFVVRSWVVGMRRRTWSFARTLLTAFIVGGNCPQVINRGGCLAEK